MLIVNIVCGKSNKKSKRITHYQYITGTFKKCDYWNLDTFGYFDMSLYFIGDANMGKMSIQESIDSLMTIIIMFLSYLTSIMFSSMGRDAECNKNIPDFVTNSFLNVLFYLLFPNVYFENLLI
jgi:hypothetical protein